MAADAPLLRDRAYDRFVEHLLTGGLKPGLFVSQRDLVGMVGQPLGPVREMVQRLEQDGLLTIVPRRGMQIAHVDLEFVRQAYQFRLFLEREAVAVFTEAAASEVLAKLRCDHEALLVEAGAASPHPDVEARAEAMDWALHDQIIDFLGNRIISTAYRTNSIKMRIIARERTRTYCRVLPAIDEHLQVIVAMQRRDVPAAVDAITRHINASKELALRV